MTLLKYTPIQIILKFKAFDTQNFRPALVSFFVFLIEYLFYDIRLNSFAI